MYYYFSERNQDSSLTVSVIDFLALSILFVLCLILHLLKDADADACTVAESEGKIEDASG